MQHHVFALLSLLYSVAASNGLSLTIPADLVDEHLQSILAIFHEACQLSADRLRSDQDIQAIESSAQLHALTDARLPASVVRLDRRATVARLLWLAEFRDDYRRKLHAALDDFELRLRRLHGTAASRLIVALNSNFAATLRKHHRLARNSNDYYSIERNRQLDDLVAISLRVGSPAFASGLNAVRLADREERAQFDRQLRAVLRWYGDNVRRIASGGSSAVVGGSATS